MATIRESGQDARSARVDADDDSTRRSRRRGAALVRAILQATWDELAAVGYADLTMEGIAARAGTSKAVVYRRWPNRPALVLEALRNQGPLLSGDVPDTGSLRGDVLALLRRVSRRLGEVGQEIIYGLLADFFRDLEQYSYLQREVLQVGSEVMMTILRRAAERGEVRLDKITRRIASLPVDLLRHELFITHASVTDPVIVEIVDDIFLPLVRA
jgi:AcrR family transcriptional regulator